MAQSAPAAPAPSPEEVALITFARSTIDLLTFWPALRIAFQQGFGHTDSRTHLAEDVVDLFYTTAMEPSSTATASSSSNNNVTVPPQDEVEATLMHVLTSEFAITLEDGSEKLVARDLIRLWKECLLRATTTPPYNDEGLAEQFKVAAEKAKKEDGEGSYAAQSGGPEAEEGEVSDEDSDEDDSDEEMDGVVEASTSTGRQREEPIIDEDGFQMVTKKGGRK